MNKCMCHRVETHWYFAIMFTLFASGGLGWLQLNWRDILFLKDKYANTFDQKNLSVAQSYHLMQAASKNVKDKKVYTSNVAEFDLVMQVLSFWCYKWLHFSDFTS